MSEAKRGRKELTQPGHDMLESRKPLVLLDRADHVALVDEVVAAAQMS